MEDENKIDSLLSFVEDSIKEGYLSNSANVACGWITKTGEFHTDPYRFCHAVLKRAPAGCTLLASRTQRQSVGHNTAYGTGGWVGDELAIEYYDWLLNRSAYSSNFITKDAEYAASKGVVCSTDIPSNLLVGGLIAHRYPWEHPGLTRQWKKFVDTGLSGDMAFLLCHQFREAPGGVISSGSYSVHGALEAVDITLNLARNFINHTPNKRFLNKPFKEDTCYRRVTLAWSGGNKSQCLRNEVGRRLQERGVGGGVNPFRKVFHKDSATPPMTGSKFYESLPKISVELLGERAVA